MAELERSLIAERVGGGLRNARAKGKRLGRPKKAVDRSRIARLRRSGASWAAIREELGVGGYSPPGRARARLVTTQGQVPLHVSYTGRRTTAFHPDARSKFFPNGAPLLHNACSSEARGEVPSAHLCETQVQLGTWWSFPQAL